MRSSVYKSDDALEEDKEEEDADEEDEERRDEDGSAQKASRLRSESPALDSTHGQSRLDLPLQDERLPAALSQGTNGHTGHGKTMTLREASALARLQTPEATDARFSYAKLLLPLPFSRFFFATIASVVDESDEPAEEAEDEKIKEYLQRSDTAVIFAEPVHGGRPKAGKEGMTPSAHDDSPVQGKCTHFCDFCAASAR